MTEVEEGSAERSLLRLFGPAVLSSLTASGLGFIYWVVAARYYTPAQVGTSGSTISLITGIGVAASGGLYAVLLRTLTVHQNPRRLLWVTCGIVAAIGAIAGLIAGLLHLSTTDVPLLWLWLAVTSAVWSLFVLQDSILISLRKTTALFASNVGFGAVKLLLLGVFAIILVNFANIPTPYPYFSPAILATQCVLLPIFAIINVLHDVITPEAADTLHGLASLTSKI